MNACINRLTMTSLMLTSAVCLISHRCSGDAKSEIVRPDTPEALAGVANFSVSVDSGIPNPSGKPTIAMPDFTDEPLDIYARKKLTSAGLGTFHIGDGLAVNLTGGMINISVHIVRSASYSCWAYQVGVNVRRYMLTPMMPSNQIFSTVWTATGCGLMPRNDYHKATAEAKHLIDMAVKDIVKGNAKNRP